MYEECSPKRETSVGRTSADKVNLLKSLNKKEDMATHYSQPGLPGAPVQQETLTGCCVREIQPPVCSWAWDSTLPGDRYILDMNRKTTSATRCTLQGERADRDVSSPGTRNVGLGGGKLLQLHILWHEKLPHFFHAWRKESLLWVKHALDKVKTSYLSINSSRQPIVMPLALQRCNFLQKRIMSWPFNTVPGL